MADTLIERNIYCGYDFTDRPDWWGPTFEEITYKLPMYWPSVSNDFIFKTGIPIGTGKSHFLLKFADHYLTRKENNTLISALDDQVIYVTYNSDLTKNIKSVSNQIVNSNNLPKIEFFNQMLNFHGRKFINKLFLLDDLQSPINFIDGMSTRCNNCLFVSLEN